MDIKSKIKSLIEEVLQKELTTDTGFLDTGLLDSLLTMQLVEKIEKEFDIRISNDDFTHYNFNSLEALVELVEKTKK